MALFAIPHFKALKLTFISYQFCFLFACYWFLSFYFFFFLLSACLMETELMGLCFVYSLAYAAARFWCGQHSSGMGICAATAVGRVYMYIPLDFRRFRTVFSFGPFPCHRSLLFVSLSRVLVRQYHFPSRISLRVIITKDKYPPRLTGKISLTATCERLLPDSWSNHNFSPIRHCQADSEELSILEG